MAIHEISHHSEVLREPGRRLMHHVGLEFVEKKISGGGHRATNAGLSLTSMIDFLVVTVVFLLMSFSTSGEIPIAKGVTLPRVENAEDMLDAPMVAINGSQILVDGVSAGNTGAIESSDRLQKIDELFNILKAKHDLWLSTHQGKPSPGVVVLQVDQNVKAIVVKSVFQTAAFAGFPNVSFMVDIIPRSSH